MTWFTDREKEQMAEIATLRAENEANARAYCETEAELTKVRDEIERLREALEMVAGKRQCLDNLMSNQDIARAALEKPNG